LILTLQRRVADLWRRAADGVSKTVNWADLYQTLLDELAGLSAEGAVPDAELRARLDALVTSNPQRRPPSRTSLVREGLIEAIRPVRSLLAAIAKLPWQATGEHPVTAALDKLCGLYWSSDKVRLRLSGRRTRNHILNIIAIMSNTKGGRVGYGTVYVILLTSLDKFGRVVRKVHRCPLRRVGRDS
jgi:hypothetical protein